MMYESVPLRVTRVPRRERRPHRRAGCCTQRSRARSAVFPAGRRRRSVHCVTHRHTQTLGSCCELLLQQCRLGRRLGTLLRVLLLGRQLLQGLFDPCSLAEDLYGIDQKSRLLLEKRRDERRNGQRERSVRSCIGRGGGRGDGARGARCSFVLVHPCDRFRRGTHQPQLGPAWFGRACLRCEMLLRTKVGPAGGRPADGPSVVE